MPDLKLYTIAQLREWLEHNRTIEGLSERILSRSRAWAITHNPYVKDEDPVVAAIFVDGVNVAYTTSFPELIDGKRYWWFSALWCDPQYEGNGYGLIVIGSLVEVYGAEYCLDRWGAKATVEIFTYFGHKTSYTQRYLLGANINRTTKKGRIVYAVRKFQNWCHRLAEKKHSAHYSLKYIPYIDDTTYAFISAHQSNDYFHHEHEFLNWVIQYPFTISAPLIEKVKGKMPFSQAEMQDTQMMVVQVKEGDDIEGFYIMKQKDDSLHVLFLYYDENHKDTVFESICDHAKRLQVMQCATENEELAIYMRSHMYYPKHSQANVSFSYSATMQYPDTKQLQYGDGDCFTA